MFGNTKVLALALGLAAVVVILYNVQIQNIRKERESGKVNLLRYKLDRMPGDQVTDRDDIEVVGVSSEAAKGLSNVITEEYWKVRSNKTLTKAVHPGQWVEGDDFAGSGDERPSMKIDPANEGMALPLGNLTPGRMLRYGDRVNVWGTFQDPKTGEYKTYWVIQGLQVQGIGGQSLADAAKDTGIATYKDIQVQVDKSLVAQMFNLISHARGQSLWITLRSAKDTNFDAKKINPELMPYVKSPAAKVDNGPSASIPMGPIVPSVEAPPTAGAPVSEPSL